MNSAETAVSEHGAKQDPWELAVTLTLLNEVIRPELILEIGSWYGGSLFAWASTGARIIAVTLPDTSHVLDDGHSHGAEILYADSHRDGTRDLITAAAAGQQIDFAFIDGDHSEDGCRADYELCARLGVPVVGFHDISHTADRGVRTVWDQVRWNHPSVEIVRPSAETMGTGIVWLTS